ncbi:hypothetical protein F4859DRAFT_497802 [Xylaria cf. heliscus]|nr:hypothetical protein F4859DRAFT_497802 [Xylaria cf. heliscus]
MESPRDPVSTRPALAPRATEYSTESTPTRVTGAEDEDRHDRISQKHQAAPNETTPAYLLKWTDTEATKTRIDSVAQLRSCIREDRNSMRHLFIFHGLPVDYGMALQGALDIDPSFIEAHVGRRSYRPLRRPKAAWAHHDYPELVCQSSILDSRRHEGTYRDLVGKPPTFLTSSSGDSVMLCRASIWLSEKAHILFLDRAPWVNSTSGVSRRRYKAWAAEKMPDEEGISTVTMQIDVNGNTTPLGDEIPDLETMLCDNLQDNCSSQEDVLVLLEELAINKWGDFFETLDTDQSVSLANSATLFSQMSGSLERNLDVSRRRHKIKPHSTEAPPDMYTPAESKLQSTTTTEWEALLSRLSRRVQLSSHLSPAHTHMKMLVPRPNAETDAVAGLGADGQSNDCDYRSRNYNTGMNSAAPPDENQRSLNRVAYLGGVLLPFSIVSGILAIEEPFGPGNSQFWIFWAVTVPLVLLTLGVIYADSIRKAEVWIEVTAASSSGKSDPEDTDGLPGGIPTLPDVEQALPISGRLTEPVALSFVDDDAGNADAKEPNRIVEKRWRNSLAFNDTRPGHGEGHWAAKKRWRKEELGWMGAFATMFQLYKLKAGVPPERLRRG